MNHSKLSRKYNNYGGNNTINLQHMLDNETTETNSVSLTEMVNNLGKETKQTVAVNNLTEKDFERIIKGGKLNLEGLDFTPEEVAELEALHSKYLKYKNKYLSLKNSKQ